MQKRYWLYILKLKEGKYYVGITARSPEIRFHEHKNGIWAAEWTKHHKPQEIIYTEDLGAITKEQAEEIEHKKTRELMRQYGWKNVRGGRFRSMEYKKYFGILWRSNTENDMPTIDTFYSLIITVLFMIVSMCLIFRSYS